MLVDFRAHGNSDGNTCTIGYDESEDVKLAYDYISNKGEKNIVADALSRLGLAKSPTPTTTVELNADQPNMIYRTTHFLYNSNFFTNINRIIQT